MLILIYLALVQGKAKFHYYYKSNTKKTTLHNRLMELDHLAALETLCRVCGGRLERFKQSFQCSDKRSTERLASVDVVTEDDDPRVHPPRMSWMLPETGKEKRCQKERQSISQ